MQSDVTEEEMKQKCERMLKALKVINDEVTHKHGGPEKSTYVSISYIYQAVRYALDLPIDPKCQKCFKKGGD